MSLMRMVPWVCHQYKTENDIEALLGKECYGSLPVFGRGKDGCIIIAASVAYRMCL